MELKILTASYISQKTSWPKTGRHILAQYDSESIIVYQAYRREIAEYALAHGRFGGPFSFERMSWIKPNFMWMMYRSAWGTKPGQEFTLAIRLRREFFDNLLSEGVESFYDESQYASPEDWRRAVARSNVRVQWDPDHHPSGTNLMRRAIQLGMRRKALISYGKEQVQEIIDLTGFVAEQRENITHERIGLLVTPLEQVYWPNNPAIRIHLRLG
jgi:hypothetical protein